MAYTMPRAAEHDPERLGMRGDDIFWMLLSLLALGPDEQRALLPPIPRRADPDAREPLRNPLFALVYAFHYYMPAWCRSVDAGRDLTWPLDESIEELGLPIDGAGVFCSEAFADHRLWWLVRRAAQALLAEAGLPPHPLPHPFPVWELVSPPPPA